jgi:hypothetical protein
MSIKLKIFIVLVLPIKKHAIHNIHRLAWEPLATVHGAHALSRHCMHRVSKCHVVHIPVYSDGIVNRESFNVQRFYSHFCK